MEEKKEKIEEVSILDAEKAGENVAKNKHSEVKSEKHHAQIEELNKKIAELNDKYLRMAAELENTRRRALLDAEAWARRRAMNIAEKILPIMDAVDSALKLEPEDKGIKSMARAMETAFAQIGITKIETIGKPLNPQLHNAVQIIDAPKDAKEKPQSNTILEEIQPGYMFGDNVLRAAIVVVCK